MAKEIINNPDGFKKQISDYSSASKGVDEAVFNTSVGNVRLSSIERYFECLIEMNNLLKEYSQLSNESEIAMDNAVAKWLGVDEEIAVKIGAHSTGDF